MSRMIIEKNATKHRFVSPSADADKAAASEVTTPAMNWKAATGLGLVVGAWALRRFPKTVILTALVAGVYAGLGGQKRTTGKNPFQGEGIAKDFLH